MRCAGLLCLVLVVGCKGGGGDEPAPTPTPAPVSVADDSLSGPEEAWAWLGLAVDRGEVLTLMPDFVRIIAGEGDRDALADHYGASLAAAGWRRDHTGSDERFRTDVYLRGDLRLTLAANDEAAGGAGLGITLAQHWPALALPTEGATEVLEEPARWLAAFPAGTPAAERLGEFDAAVVAAGWTEDRQETGAAPNAAGEVRVVWYRQEVRSLRLEVFARGDGQVQVGLQVGWR